MQKKNGGKYSVPDDEGEILPNLLGLSTKKEIDKAELSGFAKAQLLSIDALTPETVFDLKYLSQLHTTALSHLYAFAGKWRTVNMSKGGFAFPAARFLPQAMELYEQEILLPLSETCTNEEQLVNDLAKSHAELLFIHPFREGNGRTARLLTTLICMHHTGKEIDFPQILQEYQNDYIAAVQQAAHKEYDKMQMLFRKAL